jgi:DNA processing protein
MNKQELTYWISLSMIPRMWTKRKNEIFVNCFKHIPQISIIQLFEEPSLWDDLSLTDEEKSLFWVAKEQLSNNSFLVEELLAQGYNIIPITSPEYPKQLKKNLGIGAPSIIYTKGNKKLFEENAVAIVGSRKADAVSLSFTNNVAAKATRERKVVVSGFAKGVDRQALDAALANNGKSIIVLPQGITTFYSGFKQYYKPIIEGKVLVMSTFFPKAPWTVEFAMARNPIIYGLANEIYVAQSDSKGGTWSGVIDGLRKGRKIFVRYPEAKEQNANLQLIQKGGIPIDFNGDECNVNAEYINDATKVEQVDYNAKITGALKDGSMSSKAIIEKCKLDWSDTKMKKYLRSMSNVTESKKRNKIFFHLKNYSEPSLFNN